MVWCGAGVVAAAVGKTWHVAACMQLCDVKHLMLCDPGSELRLQEGREKKNVGRIYKKK